MPIEHPISFQAFRKITNFIRNNGDDWEEFYTSTYSTPAIKKAAAKTKMSKKQMRRLPHPCSLDVLPSPTNKWSATTHPIKALVVGYLGYHISYKHFFFHQSRVLLTKAFATSTTASTVGDGGTPRGSTELDAICGSNCHMDMEEFRMFAYLVLGLRPAKQHETEPSKRSLLNMLLLVTEPSERSLLNMLLEDFVVISNLTDVFALDEPDDRCTLTRRLARFSLLLLGADALTPKIVARVWGENEVVRRNLGGPRGDLALVRRRLILLASVANNTFHLWLTTSFLLMPYNTFLLECAIFSNTSALTTLPSTSVNLFTPDETESTFFKITSVRIPTLLSLPTLKTSSLDGITTFSLVVIIPWTPLVWKIISSRPTAYTHLLRKKHKKPPHILPPCSTPSLSCS
jgi:hypothetical protein